MADPCRPPPWCRWLLPCLLLLSAGTARAGESYFLAVFGSQRVPNQPKYSHSFGTFVRVWGDGPCPEQYPGFESFTISWLPENLDVRVFALLPECGRNFDLHTTLRYVLDNGERVSMWGPFLIQRDLYERARCQLAHLQSGEVEYKAVDTGYASHQVSNCIHALGDIVGGTRVRIASPGWGEVASYVLTRRFEPWVLGTGQTYEWVAARLCLQNYPIIRRDFDRCGLFARRQFPEVPTGPRP